MKGSVSRESSLSLHNGCTLFGAGTQRWGVQRLSAPPGSAAAVRAPPTPPGAADRFPCHHCRSINFSGARLWFPGRCPQPVPYASSGAGYPETTQQRQNYDRTATGDMRICHLVMLTPRSPRKRCMLRTYRRKDAQLALLSKTRFPRRRGRFPMQNSPTRLTWGRGSRGGAGAARSPHAAHTRREPGSVAHRNAMAAL